MELEQLREKAINALSFQLRVKEREVNTKCGDDKTHYRKMRKQFKIDALKNLLSICFVRKRSEHSIPDQDREIVNEAIRSKLEPKYIQCLLDEYPRACEAGGVVDHVNHPIHLACSTYREIVPLILSMSPECAYQHNEEGTLPLQLYIERELTRLDQRHMVDITSAEFSSTLKLFLSLSPEQYHIDLNGIEKHNLMFSSDHLKSVLDAIQ